METFGPGDIVMIAYQQGKAQWVVLGPASDGYVHLKRLGSRGRSMTTDFASVRADRLRRVPHYR